MSKPRYDWWVYVKGVVRRYPVLLAKHRDLQTPALTVNYSEHVGSGDAQRTTETVATRELPAIQQIEFDSVTKAIEATKYMRSGAHKLKLINQVYWQQSHTMDGAAMLVHVSTATAWRWSSDFIHLVAGYMGLKD